MATGGIAIMPGPSVGGESVVDISAPRLVVAIDFGSYASGYALQWRSDYKKNKLNIKTNTKWSTHGMATFKTPTCLLLKPDKSLAAFGYDAESKYSKLEKDVQEKWFFFRSYKMSLYNRDHVSETTRIEAEDGKHLPAIDVFSKSIQYMKDSVLSYLQTSGVPYPESETKWVLTVPAIWEDPAKQLMRSAAEKAGIRADRLTMALEPEAAAIYCSQLPEDQMTITGDGNRLKYVVGPGSTVMVNDMGGGTIDITTVEIEENGTMKQVDRSGGGAWGAMKVNDKFVLLMHTLVGRTVWEQFACDPANQRDLLDFRMEFEGNKRNVKHKSETEENATFDIRLPAPLKKMWQRSTGTKRSIAELLEENELGGSVRFQHGRLEFDLDLIRQLFTETVDEIIQYVTETLANPRHQGRTIDAMILVGGFAESDLVVTSLREGLLRNGIPVVRPQSTEMAVLHGAVLFGQDEEILTSRILRHTYGVGMVMEYIRGTHDKDTMFEDENGKSFATSVFRKHVTIGDEVKLGQWLALKEYYPVEESQKTASIYIFTTDKKEAVHTTDKGCKCVGKLDIRFGDPKKRESGSPKARKAIEVALSFGGTELKVKSTDKATGKVHQVRLSL